jgi:3-oxoacyl-[acyl-carrier protein] reductase
LELNLRNKTAIVTGGSQGLGKGLCLSLAAEGVKVAVNYNRSRDKAEAVVSQIKEEYGVEAFAVQGNVAEESDVLEIFRSTIEKFSEIDILVNNAGICPPCFIKDMPTETWKSTIDINLTGTFLCSREMVRHLLATERAGKIINIASQAAFNGSSTGKGHYAATKAGVVALTVSLAKETASKGINVNAVAPGMIYTSMTAETLKVNAERYKKTIPLGRAAEPCEIADVVTFLASEKADYITGATIDVSGGMLMR